MVACGNLGKQRRLRGRLFLFLLQSFQDGDNLEYKTLYPYLVSLSSAASRGPTCPRVYLPKVAVPQGPFCRLSIPCMEQRSLDSKSQDSRCYPRILRRLALHRHGKIYTAPPLTVRVTITIVPDLVG